MPDCLHPDRFAMDGPADGKTRCALCEFETARAEVARLTADVDRMADMLRVCECGHHAVAHEGRRFFCNMKGCECAALRQPAPAGGEARP